MFYIRELLYLWDWRKADIKQHENCYSASLERCPHVQENKPPKLLEQYNFFLTTVSSWVCQSSAHASGSLMSSQSSPLSYHSPPPHPPPLGLLGLCLLLPLLMRTSPIKHPLTSDLGPVNVVTVARSHRFTAANLATQPCVIITFHVKRKRKRRERKRNW